MQPGPSFRKRLQLLVMKFLLTIMVALLWKGSPGPTAERWIIQRSSSLCIEGRSNVNSFRCEITEYLQPDTIYLFKDAQKANPITIRGGLSIKIKGFDCHQKYITQDLRKTLKADEQPLLKINLLSIGYHNGNAQNIKGMVSIELAGVTRVTDINYQVRHDQPGFMELTGTRKVLFSDFGLKPPQKLAGLIKVEEELNIRFKLVLRALQADTSIILQKQD